jgi:hypothetical protein
MKTILVPTVEVPAARHFKFTPDYRCLRLAVSETPGDGDPKPCGRGHGLPEEPCGEFRQPISPPPPAATSMANVGKPYAILTPYGHGARRNIGRIDFAGVVREVASAVSTETGVMLGFAQIFVLLFFYVSFLVSCRALLADRMVCDGDNPAI